MEDCDCFWKAPFQSPEGAAPLAISSPRGAQGLIPTSTPLPSPHSSCPWTCTPPWPFPPALPSRSERKLGRGQVTDGERGDLTGNQASCHCRHTLDLAAGLGEAAPFATATSSISLYSEEWGGIAGVRADLCFSKEPSGCCAQNGFQEQEKERRGQQEVTATAWA